MQKTADKRRIFFLKHAERDRNAKDPQALTPIGEITAFSMGVYLRTQFDIQVTTVLSSPVFKCLRTGYLMLSGIIGAEKVKMDDAAHYLLQDIKSDPDIEVAGEVWDNARKHSTDNFLTVEQSLLMLPDARLVLIKKLNHLRRLIDLKCLIPGDYLLAGLHGGVIDMAAMNYQEAYEKAGPYRHPYDLPLSFRPLGGQIEKCEGFVMTISGERVTEFSLIRLPPVSQGSEKRPSSHMISNFGNSFFISLHFTSL